jgi:hypothetical protein
VNHGLAIYQIFAGHIGEQAVGAGQTGGRNLAYGLLSQTKTTLIR